MEHPQELPPCVDIQQVTRRFGSKTVLSSMTLQVARGEIFGLLGPSGSGKTTLVKLIAGIDEASTGNVQLLGQRLPKLEMMSRIGYMAQSDALYTELSGEQNLSFFGSLFGLRGARLKERISYTMSLVGLEKQLNDTVSAYSGGMKRRLSLAVALLHEPEVLILDEPTVGIDPLLRRSIWTELEALSRSGTTIIVTTHVMDEANKCNRLGMIRDGRLIAVGPPESLKLETGSATIEEAFLIYGGAQA
ncbi:ABC transporter ATP-binding protein [Paenibacillus sp. PL2-23]|uniref:ABC transporter ATP-binding protein n=1 Tax=Paenibacillus sp. PL2-23 TaxID=2100729 RepID=UPI0030FA2D8E